MRPQNEVRTAERVKMELKIGICVKRWPQNDDHNVWSELESCHEPLEGIEPSAFALQVRCSATKLKWLVTIRVGWKEGGNCGTYTLCMHGAAGWQVG